MASQKWFRRYTVVLANNGEVVINRTGRQIVVVSATADFLLGIDDETPGEISQGFKVETEPGDVFSRVRVRNESGSSNTVVLSIGFGNVIDGRLNLSSAISSAGADVLSTVADVSLLTLATTQIAAASVSRLGVEVTNLSTTVPLRIGDLNAGAARGRELAPGESKLFRAAGALYGYNPSGATVLVGVFELGN